MNNPDIKKYVDKLNELAKKAAEEGKLEFNQEDKGQAEVMELYKIKAPVGSQVYASLTDQDLCDHIMERSRELDHVPSQKEVYFIYLLYIRQRFGNWPKALKQAVGTKRAGKAGQSFEDVKKNEAAIEEALKDISKRGEALRRPPHMKEMEKYVKLLSSKFDTWAQVLDAAGLGEEWQRTRMLFPVENLTEEEREILEHVKAKAGELGRPPLRRDLDQVSRDILEDLKEKCITWRNLLYQVGLEPVVKKKPFSDTYLDPRKGSGGKKRKKHREGE